MHLFKTEMLFLQPPRTRFAYGRHAPRLPRYGRRPQMPHAHAPDALARVDTDIAASPLCVVVERAA